MEKMAAQLSLFPFQIQSLIIPERWKITRKICGYSLCIKYSIIFNLSRGYHQTCLLVESQLGHLQTSDHPETPCVTEIDPPDGVPHFSLSLLSHLFEK